MLIPVILSGGSGTRMWPLSRAAYPKQFLALTGEYSLLQQTAKRVNGVEDLAAPIVISNAEQRFLVAEQMRALKLKPSNIVLEPVGRNTAPAVAVAALIAAKTDPEALLLILPSDHVILNETYFRALVERAARVAEKDYLVTFGIKPTSAHTGYGYIRRGVALEQGSYVVDAFVEKPNAAKAADFLADGSYYWNSGMFLFKASVYLEELGKVQPTMLEQARLAVENAKEDLDFLRLEEASFAACPSESIDYAVMEHTARAAVIEAVDLGWNDIGSWSALAEVVERDESGNNLVGDVLTENVRNCYIRAESHMVAAIGVENLVIVETADATLVTTKDHAQDVKKIVERLNRDGRGETMFHRRVFRPWGSYEGIDAGDRFQVKRIIVNPGATLSLQMHYHRAEHWIVVKGTAKVTNGSKEILLAENQSTYIPLGETHRLENPGKVPLELIEVQSGSYLGEDDIVRFDDQYGRTK
ncbi:mannose-1-phosphate guanylyltransferase/mannose-6-phosphate isomerase [Propionivibrio limicola]|uniref:mannose-1-phosphate guanylyltransferase/mannose-6-phosphate isomerase n=1 Tax=Propionivibrio limicola TaxID=167645 RepID=UPI0012909F3C|nr:mannose-1-phosphate guanylyltransferase/mannose-6-phosphate isomerase [Propionivibrio limicola]